MQKHLDSLLHKEMTRKEFITTVSVGLMSLFGFSSIIKLLATNKHSLRQQDSGYGSSAYGGRKR